MLERITTARMKTVAQPRRKSTAGRKPVRAPKENTAMTKSRQDNDVLGQPYLARHLRLIGGVAPAEALFKASELPVADFYKQLAWEVAQGHLRDGKTVLELGHAA
jgi:type I restriction enzyme, S subunit